MRRMSYVAQALKLIQQRIPSGHPAVSGYRTVLKWRVAAEGVAGEISRASFSGRSFAESAVGSGWLIFSPKMAQLISTNKVKLFSKLQQWETTTAAVVCSVTDTRSGQRMLSNVLPLAVMACLFPSRFHARAISTKTSNSARVWPSPPPSWRTWCLQLPSLLKAVADELALWMRGLYLALLFAPVSASAPLVFMLGFGGAAGRGLWMDLMLWTIERAGPAFIKWAQWSSSRPDLFPSDLCERFESLQSGAPSHAPRISLEAIEAASFRTHVDEAGCSRVNQLFDSFDAEPVASGSIAQIHRATLSSYGAELTGGKAGQAVAVKVRHPGVSGIMHRDFLLMQRAARMAGLLPGLSELRLDESIRQFGGPLKEQLDLEVEARHLVRFNKNFRRWHNVTFPQPLYPLVSPSVLVETFEEGVLISGEVNQSAPSGASWRRARMAEMGLNLYLQMLLKDNFCHADLHPGNILVKEASLPSATSWGAGIRLLSGLLGVEPQPRLVLLDAGMIAELIPQDQRNLVEFFRALTRQEGEKIGRSILTLSEQHTCKDPAAFVSDMKAMFDSLDAETIRMHTAEVFRDMIETLRQHSVTLKSTVSTIVVTTLVLEGWSSKLDPDLHILDTMRDLLGNNLKERLCRTVDRICHAPAPSSHFI